MEDLNVNQVEDNKNEKKRGFWLSAFLVLMFIANPFTSYTYASNPELITSVFPKATNEILYVLAFLAIVNVILSAGIWCWKKWGVYGFYAVICIAFAVNTYIGVGVVGSLSGLIGGVIVYFLTKSRWNHFS